MTKYAAFLTPPSITGSNIVDVAATTPFSIWSSTNDVEGLHRHNDVLLSSSLFAHVFDATTSNSLTVASAATTSTVYSATRHSGVVREFEPILPDATASIGIVAVVLVSAAAAWVWANQVVPTSRTKLAISKQRGGVKQYLDELEQASAVATATKATTTTDEMGETNNNNNNNNTNQRQLEQWLFTDWLETRRRQKKGSGGGGGGGRQKEPALPILKDAKWNSGDNPVLVATALIAVGVTFAAITERISVILS